MPLTMLHYAPLRSRAIRRLVILPLCFSNWTRRFIFGNHMPSMQSMPCHNRSTYVNIEQHSRTKVASVCCSSPWLCGLWPRCWRPARPRSPPRSSSRAASWWASERAWPLLLGYGWWPPGCLKRNAAALLPRWERGRQEDPLRGCCWRQWSLEPLDGKPCSTPLGCWDCSGRQCGGWKAKIERVTGLYCLDLSIWCRATYLLCYS